MSESLPIFEKPSDLGETEQEFLQNCRRLEREIKHMRCLRHKLEIVYWAGIVAITLNIASLCGAF